MMSGKSLRCSVEIDFYAVTSRGTRLKSCNDVYLSVCLFGQIQYTTTTTPLFPLIFYDKLRFEKIFYTAYEPSRLSKALENASVHIDLMQVSDDGNDARLLAWFNSSARDFLYPVPTYLPMCGLHDREVLLERSALFPGMSPKLEFSTKTVIEEAANMVLDPWEGPSLLPQSSRISKERKPSRTRAVHCGCNYCRDVSASVSNSCRSVSPAVRDVNDSVLGRIRSTASTSEKSPFVVRKVPDDLIGRQPCGDHLVSSQTDLHLKKPLFTGSSVCCCHVESCIICQAFKRYLGKPYHRHSCVGHRHYLNCLCFSHSTDGCLSQHHQSSQENLADFARGNTRTFDNRGDRSRSRSRSRSNGKIVQSATLVLAGSRQSRKDSKRPPKI